MASRSPNSGSDSRCPKFEAKTQKDAADIEVIPVFGASDKASGATRSATAKAMGAGYGSLLKRLEKDSAFKGARQSLRFVRYGGKGNAKHVLFVGLGNPARLRAESFRQAGALVWAKLAQERPLKTVINLEPALAAADAAGVAPWESLEAFFEGTALSTYSFGKYRSAAKGAKKEKSNSDRKIVVFAKSKADQTLLKSILDRVAQTTSAVFVTRDWSNEPANVGTAEYYASEARRLGAQNGIKVKILGSREIAREKMALVLAVNQGSTREPRVVVLDYHPKGAKKTIALVGKGVTFDSGGISIKPSARMEEMKHDMTGAATVFGAALLAAKRKCPHRVITIMGFVENMPSGNAVVPSTIITARSGTTVEINNTDAEGRLILADLLDYAQDFKPDLLINAATLTGAVGIALGKFCAGMMGNDQKMMNAFRAFAARQWERVWQLPLFSEYMADMKSEIADIRNVGNDGLGGSIRGGIFLKKFIRKQTRWVHLDIAYTGYDCGYLPYCPKKGGSGLHVRTIARFVEQL